MRHAKLRQQLPPNGLLERQVERLRRHEAEQADAHVRIAPLGARRVVGAPSAQPFDHLRHGIDRVRHLQRQAAGRVGAEFQQADAIEGAARQPGQVAGGLVIEGQRAPRLCVGGQRRRERLADRADLEKRVVGDRLAGLPRRHAVVEHPVLAAAGDGYRHAGYVVLGHQRLYGRVHGPVDRVGTWIGTGGHGNCGHCQGTQPGKHRRAHGDITESTVGHGSGGGRHRGGGGWRKAEIVSAMLHLSDGSYNDTLAA